MATPRGQENAESANRLLIRIGRHGGAWMVVLGVNVAVLTAAESVLPALLGRSIDAALGRTPAAHWFLLCVAVISVLVLSDVVDEIATTSATARSTAWLRHLTLRRILSAPLSRLDRFSPGDLVTRLVSNTEDAGAAGPDIMSGLASLFLAGAGVIALLLIDPWLCITFLIGMPVLTLIVVLFAKDAAELSGRYLETQGRIASRLVQALAGARTIAAAGTTDRETRRVLAPLTDLHRDGQDMWRVQNRLTVQDTLLVAALEIAVLGVAGFELSRGRIDPGQLFAASQYVLLASTFSSAVSSLSGLIRERAAAARVNDVLNLPTIRYGRAKLPPGPGRLVFRHVTVRAGSRELLSDVNLVVPGGAFMAVVGRSGSGKSQFARVAGRLIDPAGGAVYLDGVPMIELERKILREAVGYGFDRPALIGETLGDVISFGAHDPGGEAVAAAAQAARADDFIRRMPQGYDTPLAEAPMSGGEAQRVGLARTFAHATRVMILDDVAASLDTVTEFEVSRALTGSMSDRTRILVAHRASTAARADVVLWLEDGRLRECAPHDVLWRSEEYRALFEPDVVQAHHSASEVADDGLRTGGGRR